MTTPAPVRDKRGRFASPKACRITRELGGYWCNTHRRWADDGHVRTENTDV